MPRLYVDTNIFLDVIRRRRGCEDSISLFEDFKKGEYEAVTSTLTLLEVYHKQQEEMYCRRHLVDHRRTFDEVRRSLPVMSLGKADLEDLSQCIDNDFWNSFVKTRLVELIDPDKEVWGYALVFMKKTVISPLDAIHLSVAVQEKCDMLVTKDQALIKRVGGYIDASIPQNVAAKLEALRYV